MKIHSISEAVKELRVGRKTLWRWVKHEFIPEPKAAAIVRGRLVKCWTEKEFAKVREYKANFYGGKGMDRKKGSRAEQMKSKKR